MPEQALAYERSVKGMPFQIVGPTTEKARAYVCSRLVDEVRRNSGLKAPSLIDLTQWFPPPLGSVRIAGGFAGLNPHLTLPTPYLWSKLDPGGRISTP